MYLCTYMSVMLRNVNLCSCSGIQVSRGRAFAMYTFGEVECSNKCCKAQFLTPALRVPPISAMCIDTLAHSVAQGVIYMCTPSLMLFKEGLVGRLKNESKSHDPNLGNSFVTKCTLTALQKSRPIYT